MSHRMSLGALLIAALAGCAVTVKESKKVGRLGDAPESLTLIWSAAKPPKFDSLPAFGIVLITPPGTIRPGAERDNLDPEFTAFGAALGQQLPAAPLPNGSAVISLQPHHTAEQLAVEIARAPKDSAVLVMYPEAISAYCTAGCYAYDIRVNYLSTNTRRLVWTGRISLPPKQRHRDSFDPLALQFLETLQKQLDQERLLGRRQDAGASNESLPATLAGAAATATASGREHRKRVPAASGFARGDDVASVPVRAEGKDRYLHYLTLPAPKAFVVYQSGGWRFFFDDRDAMTHALDRCARDGVPCWLYAVDNDVVWDKAPERRIGRSDQLSDR